MKRKVIEIFTDGASSGNPGNGGWGAILLSEEKALEQGGGAAQVTNNEMEMTAALRALESLQKAVDPKMLQSVRVYTDSRYLIQGITKWVFGWKKNGWKTAGGDPVMNRELWEALDRQVYSEFRGIRIDWIHVPGHAGVPANERADEIATSFSKGTEPDLFYGEAEEYDRRRGIRLELGERDFSTAVRAKKSKKGGGKAYSYLSLVGGKAMRHQTWAECEGRVKGQPNVKYRKARSAEEEREILAAWGVSAESVEG